MKKIHNGGIELPLNITFRAEKFYRLLRLSLKIKTNIVAVNEGRPPLWKSTPKLLNKNDNKALLMYEFCRGKKFSSYHQMALVQNATMMILSPVDIECKKQ